MATFRFPGGLDPILGLRYMQREFERMFGRSEGAAEAVAAAEYPPVNVLSGEEEILVQCEVAGVAREDLDLTITGETLTVRGTKRPPGDEEQLRYQRRERGVGDFARTIVLPDRIDADRAEAKVSDGVLTVRLPKAESARPRQIRVS